MGTPPTRRTARLMVAGLLGTFQYSALRKFLTAQKLARPGMWVQAGFFAFFGQFFVMKICQIKICSCHVAVFKDQASRTMQTPAE